MIEFFKLIDLMAEIEKDKALLMSAAARYPVRFILLDDFYHYSMLIRELDVTRVDLSNKLEHDNAWFGPAKLTDVVNTLEEPAVVYPISEIIRFFKQDDASGFFASVFLKQNQGNSRLYIPLVGLKEMFLKFWNSYNRKDEGPPVWYLKTDEDYIKMTTVYLCEDTIDTRLPVISNNREWLRYWDGQMKGHIITKTNSLKMRWSEFLPNGCFNKEHLQDAKSYFVHIYGMDFNKQFAEDESEFWNALLAKYEDEPNKETYSALSFLEKLTGIGTLKNALPKTLMNIYMESELFCRWLLCLLAHQTDDEEGYLTKVLKNVAGYEVHDFIHGLYYMVFQECSEKEIKERKDLIESLPTKYRVQTDRFISNFINSLGDEPGHLNYVTNYTIQEKEHLISTLMKTENLNELMNRIICFREYLNWQHNGALSGIMSPEIIEYFQHYTKSKLLNRKTTEFDYALDCLNGDSEKFYKWFYKTPLIEPSKTSALIQFDGVGIEWLPYILHLIQQNPNMHNKVVEEVGVRRVDIPSTTHVNKLPEAESFVRDFDRDVIHSIQGYKHPITLIEEMEKIEALVTDYILLSPHKSIVLTADHGCTCMCLSQFGAVAMNRDMDSNHEGRYTSCSKGLSDNSYFISYHNYYVALKHNVLSTLPQRETHGGATPEEVLVPYIKIGVNENSLKSSYVINVLNRKLEFSKKMLELTISPIPKSNPIIGIADRRIEGVIKGDKYTFNLSEVDSGAYNVTIIVECNIYAEKIEILSGFVEENLFDE